jgi:hypothetical protein
MVSDIQFLNSRDENGQTPYFNKSSSHAAENNSESLEGAKLAAGLQTFDYIKTDAYSDLVHWTQSNGLFH